MRVRAVRGLSLPLAGVLAGLALAGCTDPEASGRVDDAVRASQAPVAAPAKDTTEPRRDQRIKKPRRPARSQAEQAAAGTALAALATLDVKGRAPMTGYDRGAFGQEWLDTNRNGCDTRNDILARHLTDTHLRPGTSGCVVLTGVPSTTSTPGRRIDFVRGDGFLVDIDHVVALGNAWSGGAARWDIRKRAAFANDPLNLLPADAGANRAKGDGDAATWLPPNKAFRCAYVARQVAVKAKYGLPVTPAEGDAVNRILAACPSQQLPPDSGAPSSPPSRSTPPRTPPSHPASSRREPADAAAYYENCDAARAAGAAPVHRGDPGYGRHLDGDGDGAGCE